MSTQVYSVPGWTEGRGKPFLEWESVDLSYELSLTWTISVHHPIPTREKKEHPGDFQYKSVISAFNWVSRYILFLAKLKVREKPFLESARKGGGGGEGGTF